MIRVNLVAQIGNAILPEEAGAIDLLVSGLSVLDLEQKRLQLRMEHREHRIAGQALREALASDLRLR